MINSKDIQKAYVQLYKVLRNYLWEIHVVFLIVEIELNAYSAIPDTYKLTNQLSRLRSYVYSVLQQDEDMQKAFDDFFELLDSGNQAYAKVIQIQEVIPQ